MDMKTIYLLIPLAPLFGALVAGLFGWAISRRVAHTVTIAGVAVACGLSLYTLNYLLHGGASYNEPVYNWLTINGVDFNVGFLVDKLTAMMMCVVTFVSLMVHIYTIGYMAEDPGYNRFFSYISLFTFSMLMLVMSNNFVQLFFGWEAVGLVSYLLIGFWFKRPTATFANLKAFLVNRVGDFGFLLGIGLVLGHFGSLDYAAVFAKAPELKDATITIFAGHPWSLLSLTCILLFVGAMGKSAQFPLHVWLPDSMEGPTPISALIHAATMVTAGIFMVTRMSPLFELSDTALNFILVIGSITALFMGFLGIIQDDIKRVVAYSTLSQLGYMTVALGVSAYSVAVFHLMTHAFFKALLFLGAGSVIMGMHHDQNIRNMGGLRKYMPITWITSLIGSLALIGTPFFSGFYSKDSIIDAVSTSHLPGAHFAYFAVVAGVFVTAFYSFRMYFLVFHGQSRWMEAKPHHAHADAHHAPAAHGAHAGDDHAAHGDDHEEHHGLGPNDKPHESPWVVTLPLILLAIPSALIGFFAIQPMLFGDFFKGVIFVNNEAHPAMEELAHEFGGAAEMGLHAFAGLPVWLALAGVVLSYVFYILKPELPKAVGKFFSSIGVTKLLENKYYMDFLYINVFAAAGRALGTVLWKVGDALLIDGLVVNGAARLVQFFSFVVRRVQTGYIYHYAFAMILGALVMITLWIGIPLYGAMH
ncbi:NADH-quinone oxidoreductase subunit L [Amantichitinum ursilacus]|uniref:NADH-quinone oxidoreductase subunit L n=1 Tax=Amantichitinum ursilacus TaxID=857265 RepID=A0A0N1JT83_9NEIS|nr:NADH-quinone oxidoreductase subunit L [Amantichitinum ursilacus]KPC54556.1 NADH-quinone oxidoreductase subunit L [Amantichitinum ursilacus]